MMHKFRLSLAALLLVFVFPGVGHAQDDAALKLRIQSRSTQVVQLLKSGACYEGADGMLKAAHELDATQQQLMKAENQDRQTAFALIATKSNVAASEVAQMYAKRARSKFPVATQAGAAMPAVGTPGYGACKLVPTATPDTQRLLEYMKQGMNYASQKKFDLALQEFQTALVIDQNFLGLHQNIGTAQRALKQYGDAEQSYQNELKLIDCLTPLPDDQLSLFGYFKEAPDKDPVARKKAQTEALRKDLPRTRAFLEYNLACLYAAQNRKEDALKALSTAADAGFSNQKLAASDPDLRPLASSPEFRQILARMH